MSIYNLEIVLPHRRVILGWLVLWYWLQIVVKTWYIEFGNRVNRCSRSQLLHYKIPFRSLCYRHHTERNAYRRFIDIFVPWDQTFEPIFTCLVYHSSDANEWHNRDLPALEIRQIFDDTKQQYMIQSILTCLIDQNIDDNKRNNLVDQTFDDIQRFIQYLHAL